MIRGGIIFFSYKGQIDLWGRKIASLKPVSIQVSPRWEREIQPVPRLQQSSAWGSTRGSHVSIVTSQREAGISPSARQGLPGAQTGWACDTETELSPVLGCTHQRLPCEALSLNVAPKHVRPIVNTHPVIGLCCQRLARHFNWLGNKQMPSWLPNGEQNQESTDKALVLFYQRFSPETDLIKAPCGFHPILFQAGFSGKEGVVPLPRLACPINILVLWLTYSKSSKQGIRRDTCEKSLRPWA